MDKTQYKKKYRRTFEADPQHCPKTKDGIHMFKYDRDFKPTYCTKCKIRYEDIKNGTK